MIWAKVINDEIMQLHDEDPSGLWHPDLLDVWEQVPSECQIGWKRKNGKWISGEQWGIEWTAENPPPLPGPPSAFYSVSTVDQNHEEITVKYEAHPGGIWDSYSWVINGTEYGQEEEVTVTYMLQETKIAVEAVLTVIGPGGTVTSDTQTPFILPVKVDLVSTGVVATK